MSIFVGVVKYQCGMRNAFRRRAVLAISMTSLITGERLLLAMHIQVKRLSAAATMTKHLVLES